MLKKAAKRNLLYDRLHRVGVYTCIGLTLYAGTNIAMFFYNYYVNVRPELVRKKEESEAELLSEGSSDHLLLQDNAKQFN